MTEEEAREGLLEIADNINKVRAGEITEEEFIERMPVFSEKEIDSLLQVLTKYGLIEDNADVQEASVVP